MGVTAHLQLIFRLAPRRSATRPDRFVTLAELRPVGSPRTSLKSKASFAPGLPHTPGSDARRTNHDYSNRRSRLDRTPYRNAATLGGA